MPARAVQCPQRDTTLALVDGQLKADEKRSAERHLERCEPCRSEFRSRTAGRFPRIRSYTILEELGKGGFGVVYKAVHHSKERIEAIKVLFAKTPLRQAYFENEVHLIARLRHPNIATLHEAHLQTAPHYYAMEHVEGQDLDEYFRSHDVSLEQRIEIVMAVARAIEYAHQAGVVHRDLKPQNILIDADGQPRVLDFGIAKRMPFCGDEGPSASSPLVAEGALGTYGYMSPEQLAGQTVDERSDVYSLGALLFHVITGQPARFATQLKRLAEVLHDRRVSRADDLAAIIAHCVDPVPENRYANCTALIADLDNYVAGRPIWARQNTTPAYQFARTAGLMVRNYPATLQTLAVVVVTSLLTPIFWKAGARWLVPGRLQDQVALITFEQSTEEAVREGRIGAGLAGFEPGDYKSRRVLFGQLMEHLAGSHARAIVWDFYFPGARPELDPAFVRGVQAAGIPVVVGAAQLDVNGEPILSPAIREAVHGWGTLWAKKAAFLHDEINMPLAVKRGLNPPSPSLAVAGFAVALHPECRPHLHVDGATLVIQFEKRQIARGEGRWLPETSRLDIFEVERVGPQHDIAGVADGFQRDDVLCLGRYRLDSILAWGQRGIPFEDVLAANPEQLRAWFGGRAVVIGECSPRDMCRLRSGEIIYGCQIHAHMLDALLAGTNIGRYQRHDLILRIALWCVLGVALAHLVPIRENWPLRAASVLGLGLSLAGVVWAMVSAPWITSVWALQATLAGCSLVAAGSVATVLRLLHRRQLRLTPGPVWSAGETTVSTAMLEPLDSSSGHK